ncbi:MAG: hypothetical protein K8823_921 [Cenarchaeum symbiont of Oopsacas minuta]|nr:hypothetical protein [Cenarchaeum symbiont of Oopsacas minuta]
MSDTVRIKEKIFQLESALIDMDSVPVPAPEMLDAANALRLCEHFTKTDTIKSDLIASYAKYSTSLETLVTEALEIQKGLNAFIQKNKSLKLYKNTKQRTVNIPKKRTKNLKKTSSNKKRTLTTRKKSK